MRAYIILFVLFLTSFYSTVGQQPEPMGFIQNGIYRNQSLGFEITIPPGWYVATSEQQTAVTDDALKALKTGNAKVDAALGRSKKYETINLMVTKKPFGVIKNTVLGFSLTKQQSEAITSKMIAEATKTMFVANPTFSLEKDVSFVTLGNREFATLDFTVDAGGSVQYVRVLITMIKNQALTFALTYWDKDNFKMMLDSLNTLKFEK